MRKMKIYFIMNSLNDAHANKRAADFKKQGHEVRMFGFLRHQHIKFDNGAEVIGQFTADTPYRSRINIYMKGLRSLFSREKDPSVVWYYQGLDVALFATLLNPNKKYIYEECDLVHTYMGSKWISSIFEKIDKRIIRKSLSTVTTSEGFINYHYQSADLAPGHVVLVPNKLSSAILDYGEFHEPQADMSHLRFAFVGGLRYKALLSIADIISREFPQHEFHFYGFVDANFSDDMLPRRANIFYHGPFRSPDHLYDIYQNVDLLISTYDITSMNVRFAEPNKLYEAIYFRCPIIVSSGTFLASKVRRKGIGYDVDAFSREDVIRLVNSIPESYQQKKENLRSIAKAEALDDVSYVTDILKNFPRQ